MYVLLMYESTFISVISMLIHITAWNMWQKKQKTYSSLLKYCSSFLKNENMLDQKIRKLI